MANVKSFEVNGVTYPCEDSEARSQLSNLTLSSIKDYPKVGSVGQVFTKTENGVAWQNPSGVSQDDFDDLSDEVDSVSGKVSYYENAGFLSQNIWDENTESGRLYPTDGREIADEDYIRTGWIPVDGNTDYYFSTSNSSISGMTIMMYDEDKDFLSTTLAKFGFKTATWCKFIRFYFPESYGTTYLHDVAIVKGTSGTYMPYVPSNNALLERIEALEAIINGLTS